MEIIKEIKNDPKLLTPFSVLQLLGACSRRGHNRSTRELMSVDTLLRNLPSILEDTDNDQKTQLFKFISSIELAYNPPRYRLPIVLFNIRAEIKDKLDTLNEISIINLIQSYAYLPREFPSDILEDIKEMVIVTVEHNPVGIKSFFLIEFIEEILNIFKRRRMDEK